MTNDEQEEGASQPHGRAVVAGHAEASSAAGGGEAMMDVDDVMLAFGVGMICLIFGVSLRSLLDRMDKVDNLEKMVKELKKEPQKQMPRSKEA